LARADGGNAGLVLVGQMSTIRDVVEDAGNEIFGLQGYEWPPTEAREYLNETVGCIRALLADKSCQAWLDKQVQD